MNKLIGTIQSIGEPQQITEKFSKLEMILSSDDLYPQTLCVEWPNDAMTIPQGFKEGDMVEVDINIRGREWTSPKGDVRYFTSLTGWKMALVSGTKAPKESPASHPAAQPDTDEDDLPF
jgi:single-strand DNA-binding protein